MYQQKLLEICFHNMFPHFQDLQLWGEAVVFFFFFVTVCMSRSGNLLHLNSKNPQGNEIIEIRETDSGCIHLSDNLKASRHSLYGHC